MSRFLLSTLLLVIVTTAAVGASDRIVVVVSIEPQRWLVEQIGGQGVVVTVLVEPGESPETYQPTDAQVTRLMRADLYLSIGVPFERGPWFEAMTSTGGVRLVDSRQGIDLLSGDPHIWLSPRLLAIQARTVAGALSRLDPAHRTVYQTRSTTLEERLAELDQRLEEQLAPFSGRTFLVLHPSWTYFARDYELVQLAIEVEGHEPSDRELTLLQDRARQTRATTVFVQPQFKGRGVRVFAKAIGGRVEILDPLAADVVTNLESTADKLVRAFSGEGMDEQ